MFVHVTGESHLSCPSPLPSMDSVSISTYCRVMLHAYHDSKSDFNTVNENDTSVLANYWLLVGQKCDSISYSVIPVILLVMHDSHVM